MSSNEQSGDELAAAALRIAYELYRRELPGVADDDVAIDRITTVARSIVLKMRQPIHRGYGDRPCDLPPALERHA